MINRNQLFRLNIINIRLAVYDHGQTLKLSHTKCIIFSLTSRECDVCRRQIPTYKVDPGTVRVKICIITVDP